MAIKRTRRFLGVRTARTERRRPFVGAPRWLDVCKHSMQRTRRRGRPTPNRPAPETYPPYSPSRPEPARPPSAGRWEQIGYAKADARNDTDSVTIGRRWGSFRTLRVRVLNSRLRMHEMVIEFTDGSSYTPRTSYNFRPGQTQTIDLPGNRRTIRRIWFRYSDLPRGGSADVEIWGR